MPMRGEVARRLRDLLGRRTDEGDRLPAGDHPAHVGRERLGVLEADRAGQVRAGVGTARLQVDDPFAGLDAAPQLGRVDRVGWLAGERRRALPVRRGHRRVVAGVGGEPREEAGDELALVLDDERQVPRALVLDRGGRRRGGRRGGAEAAEAVGRQHGDLARELAGEPADRPVLGTGELVGQGLGDEVRAPHRPEEHRAPGQHRVRDALFGHDVGEVARRVAGRGARRHRQAPRRELVAGRHRAAGERHVLLGGDEVVGARHARELEAAGDVVVVHVGLGDERDLDARGLRRVEHDARRRAGGRRRCRSRRRGRGRSGLRARASGWSRSLARALTLVAAPIREVREV